MSGAALQNRSSPHLFISSFLSLSFLSLNRWQKWQAVHKESYKKYAKSQNEWEKTKGRPTEIPFLCNLRKSPSIPISSHLCQNRSSHEDYWLWWDISDLIRLMNWLSLSHRGVMRMMKNTDIDLLVFSIYEAIFVKMDLILIKSHNS